MGVWCVVCYEPKYLGRNREDIQGLKALSAAKEIHMSVQKKSLIDRQPAGGKDAKPAKRRTSIGSTLTPSAYTKRDAMKLFKKKK